MSQATHRAGDASVFALNLRTLTTLKGLKASTAAKEIQHFLLESLQSRLKTATRKTAPPIQDQIEKLRANPIDPQWYRRLMRKGITRQTETTKVHLAAVAFFFGRSIEDFWDEHLIKTLNPITEHSVAWQTVSTVPCMKLKTLLEERKGFEFLIELIDTLYEKS